MTYYVNIFMILYGISGLDDNLVMLSYGQCGIGPPAHEK